MNKNIYMLTLALGLYPVCSMADVGNSTHIIEVKNITTKEQRSEIANLGVSVEEVYSDKVFIYGTDKDARTLREHGFDANSHQLKEAWLSGPGTVGGETRYHSYEEVSQALRNYENTFSQIASVSKIGSTNEGRDILALRISGKTPAQAEAQQLPVALYMGCHHAREHLSVEVPFLFAQYLLENYGKNPDVTRLVDSREIYISPVINPDGHVFDFVSNNGRGRMWRKNRRVNGDGTYGVDLNRNYGFQWGTGGSSEDHNSDVYMGPEPFSEPETVTVREFIRSQKRMKVLLSFHSFSELILYPWGHTYDPIGSKGKGRTEDFNIFKKMAQTMAQWNHYTPQQSSGLYIASGDTTDWAYGELGIIAFTFELSPTSMWSGGFYPNPKMIPTAFQANLKPMMYLLEYADNPSRVLREPGPSFLQTPSKSGFAIASPQDALR